MPAIAARILRAALSLGAWAALAACSDSSPAGPDDDPVVTFPDPVVEAAVRERIVRREVTGIFRDHTTHTGPIRQSHLDGITSLHTGPGVTTLSGVEHLRDLVHLKIRGTRDGPDGASAPLDLAPVGTLTKLGFVEVADTRNPDLTPLARLQHLEELFVKRSEISDLSPLAQPPRLRSLHIERSEISDLSSLRALGGLTRLAIVDTPQLGDEGLAPLSALDGLETLVLLRDGISDIAPLRGLHRLRTLMLAENRIADLTPLAGLERLGDPHLPDGGLSEGELLDLRKNEIVDIAPLLEIPVISGRRPRRLNLGGNPLSAKALCEDLPALQARGWTHDGRREFEPCPP